MNIQTINFMKKNNANGVGIFFKQRDELIKDLTNKIYGYNFSFNTAELGNAFSLPKHLFFLDKFAFKDHLYYSYFDYEIRGIGYISQDTYDIPSEVIEYFKDTEIDKIKELFALLEGIKIK